MTRDIRIGFANSVGICKFKFSRFIRKLGLKPRPFRTALIGSEYSV